MLDACIKESKGHAFKENALQEESEIGNQGVVLAHRVDPSFNAEHLVFWKLRG
jgi:hypothetical protein